MKWTDKPTEPGWYWVEYYPDCAILSGIAEVYKRYDSALCVRSNLLPSENIESADYILRYFGPIPGPDELIKLVDKP